MTTNSIDEIIDWWSEWAREQGNNRYDIALLKIWIQFEKFLAELFVSYAIGESSESGYYPELKLQFCDEGQLTAFLREGNKKYVEYISQIEKLSKHIFVNDPFQIIFLDSENKEAFNQIRVLRNYIAHESGEAKLKLIRYCFGGNDNNFVEPNVYLQRRERKTHVTYFTYYVNRVKNMARLLINPPDGLM